MEEQPVAILPIIPTDVPHVPSIEAETNVSVEPLSQVHDSDNSTKTNGGSESTAVVSNELDEPEVDDEKMETSSTAEPNTTELVSNGELLSPTQLKKRNRSRDDLNLSPDLTKTGKRQRKTNILFSGYALDKKTTHVISGQENREGEQLLSTDSEHMVPISSPISSPTSATTSLSSPNSSAVNPSLISPNSEGGTFAYGKKEVLLTPQDAQLKAKKLPKGYAYEPVVYTPSKNESLPLKRERKKVALADYVEVEKPSLQFSKPPKKQKTNKTKKQLKKQQQQQQQQLLLSPSSQVNSANTNEDVNLQMLKKQELENQLNALTQQLAMVSQTLETKTKQVQALEKLEKLEPIVETTKEEKTTEETVNESNGGNGEEPKTIEQQPITTTTTTLTLEESDVSLPSGTIIKRIIKKQTPPKKPKRTQSVYDRFESDDDTPLPKKGRSGKINKKKGDSGPRPQRNRKKFNFDEEESEEGEVASKFQLEEIDETTIVDYLRPCLKILVSLMKHHYGWPFNQPVDIHSLQIPDYFDVVKHPMDLGTVLENVKGGRYPSVDEFGDDVRLVFKNALTYNQPGSDICIMANALAGIFEKRFAKMGGKAPPQPSTVPKERPSPPKPVPIVPSTEVQSIPVDDTTSKTKAELANTISDLRDSMKFVREEISKWRKEKAANSPAVSNTKSRPPRPPKDEPLSFDEKCQLSASINQLPPENLGKVVQIIHQRMPYLAQNSPDEIEIDIDALDTATLRALEKYVKTALSKKKNIKGRNTSLPKHIQAEQTAQQTSKSIQDVKKKLKELSSKTSSMDKKLKKKKEQEDLEDVDIDDDTPAKTYPSVEITKDKGSSSSSSSSDSSSSSSDSSSDEEKIKKTTAVNQGVGGSVPQEGSATVSSVSLDGQDKPEQDQRDTILPSPEREQNEATIIKMEESKEPEPSPQILQATVKKEVQLKNLDSWTNLTLEADPTTSLTDNQKKDETWSQFQNRDLQNKIREKEREEQQEKEKKEKEAREAERRRQEEIRAKEMADLEYKKQQEIEEQKVAAQRELAAKRAAEKKAREEESAHRINMMEQNLVMSSFELGMEGTMDPTQILKLKEKENDKEEKNEKEEV